MNRILIIDDDEELTELVSEYLGAEGFDTVAVHSGDEGLDKAKHGNYDLAVLDVMLPGMAKAPNAYGKDFLIRS